MGLPPAVRQDVALRLLDSLAISDQRSVDDAWAAEISSRVDDVLSVSVETVPGEQVFAELAARRAVTITRHAQAVGLFNPVRPDRQAAVDAYAAAAKKANDLLVEMGLDEDEIVTEFEARRKAKRNSGSAP